MYNEERIYRCVSSEYDVDEDGREFNVGYSLFKIVSDADGAEFMIFYDDGSGNGACLCRGDHESDMMKVMRALGKPHEENWDRIQYEDWDKLVGSLPRFMKGM